MFLQLLMDLLLIIMMKGIFMRVTQDLNILHYQFQSMKKIKEKNLLFYKKNSMNNTNGRVLLILIFLNYSSIVLLYYLHY
jgi:hypothetical protein